MRGSSNIGRYRERLINTWLENTMPCLLAGHFLYIMDIKRGCVYHFDCKYIDKINDILLIKNKEKMSFCPTFLCTKNEKISLLCMVSMSSQADKHEIRPFVLAVRFCQRNM